MLKTFFANNFFLLFVFIRSVDLGGNASETPSPRNGLAKMSTIAPS